jgi:hypothetical protein
MKIRITRRIDKMKKLAKIMAFAALLAIIQSVAAIPDAKKPVKYPLGFRHDMSRNEAIRVLQSLEAEIVGRTDQSIHARYGKRYFGIIINDINLQFDDDHLQSVSLRTDGEESDQKNNDRLREFTNLIKAIYDVSERSSGSPSSVDTTSDIRTRFVSRYENGSYEILIYSYYLNDKYYLTFNFEKFF